MSGCGHLDGPHWFVDQAFEAFSLAFLGGGERDVAHEGGAKYKQS